MGDLIRYGVIGTGMMGFEHPAFHRPVELAELGL